MLVDLTQPVREFLPAVSKKSFLKNIDEYSFKVRTVEHLRDKKKDVSVEKWVSLKQPLTKQYPSTVTLLLRKRFYLVETVLDQNDAFQVHLAYVQSREELMSGIHPITKEECAMFGGLQAIMEHGTFNEQQYKAGRTPITLKAWVPAKFVNSSMEKDVLHQWKEFGNMTAETARYRFMQVMQTLRTYGYNLYPVQVPDSSKKGKSTTVVLGINDKKIVRMSEDCKAVIKDIEFTHLKKWTFDDTNIILDFGSHGHLFSGATEKRKEISELIGGYIDIILKKMKVRSSGEEEEEETVAEETSIGSIRGNLTSGFTSSLSSTGVPMLNMQQIVDFATGSQAVSGLSVEADELLRIFAEGMKVSMNEDQVFSQIRSQASALMALLPDAFSSVLSGDVGKQLELAKRLAGQMASLMSNANMAAFGFSLTPEQQRQLITASHQVNAALSKYMAALEALKADPKNPQLLAAAEAARLAAESAIIGFTALSTGTYLDEAQQALLTELAQNVKAYVDNLGQVAQSTASMMTPGLQASIYQSGSSADALLESAKALGGLTGDDACKEKLLSAIDNVGSKTGALVANAPAAGANVAMCEQWKTEVDNTLDQMRSIANIPKFEGSKEYLGYLSAANAILEGTGNIMNETPLQLETAVRANEQIMQNYPLLVGYAKNLAQNGDDMQRDRAVECSQAIHTNARAIDGSVGDAQRGLFQQEKLKGEATALNAAVQHLLAESGNEAAKLALLDSSKNAAQLTVAHIRATNSFANGSGRGSAQSLLSAAANAAAAVKRLVGSIVGASSNEGDTIASVSELLNTAVWFNDAMQETLIEPVRASLSVAPAAAPDRAEVVDATQKEVQALERLKKSTTAYQTIDHYNSVDQAAEGFRAALADLEWMEMALEVGQLPKAENVSIEQELQALGGNVSQFGVCIKTVARAAKQNEEMKEPVLELSAQCQALMGNLKVLVTASKYNREQKTLLEAGRSLMNELNRLVGALKTEALNPSDQHLQQVLGSIAGSAVALQGLSRTAKQLEGLPLGANESEANLPKFDTGLETKALELLDKLSITAEKAVRNVDASLEQARADAKADDARAQVQVAVLEALKALVSTASNVVTASNSAQRELVTSLSTPATSAMYARDPKMAQGLIEACGQVNAAISSLSAGDLSVITQHELITQAEALSKACEVLAFATRAGTRSNNSDAARRILDAAAAVSAAVKTLVEAAKQVEDVPEVEEVDVENFGIDPATLAEIRQMMKIVELEKQLIHAKKSLAALEAKSHEAKEWNK